MLVYTACLTLAVSICVGSVCPVQCPVQNEVQNEVIVGWASQYAKGVFPRVIQLRQKWGQLPKDLSVYDGFVATRHCGKIGNVVWLRPLGSQAWEIFLIADCASRSDSRWQDGLSGYEWMLLEGILVELDYETAVRWETLGRGIQIELSRNRPLVTRVKKPDRWHFRKHLDEFSQ